MPQQVDILVNVRTQGPYNAQPVVRALESKLRGINAQINPTLSPTFSRNIAGLTNNVRSLNAGLGNIHQRAQQVGGSLRSIRMNPGATAAVATLHRELDKSGKALDKLRNSLGQTHSAFAGLGNSMGTVLRRFAQFYVVAKAIDVVRDAFGEGVRQAVSFQHEMTRLSQIGGTSATAVGEVSSEITRLSTTMGVSSEELSKVSVTLRQAGLSADDTRVSLQALAKTTLAPTFDSLKNTVEGSIAAMQQFKFGAKDLEGVLGSINKVAGDFAVESSDLVTAIRKAGGAFRAANGDFVSGRDSLNQFLALFTSVRQTTREGADEISTGLRTIFGRIQDKNVSTALKDMGINLHYTAEEARVAGNAIEGQFVGAYEAIKRISSATKGLATTDPRFSQIVQQIGGYRQISRVIPLLQQGAVAQRAYAVAQSGVNSLTADSAKAQGSFQVQLGKVKEQFVGVVRAFGDDKWLKDFLGGTLTAASHLITLANALRPLLPLLTAIAATKIFKGLGSFLPSFTSSVTNVGSGPSPTRHAVGGVVPGTGSGDCVPANIPAGSFVVKKRSAQSIGYHNLAAQGGSGRGAHGGHTVPVLLEPGEFVFDDVQASHIGHSRLHQWNSTGTMRGRKKFAQGGTIRNRTTSHKRHSIYSPISVTQDEIASLRHYASEDSTYHEMNEQLRGPAPATNQHISRIQSAILRNRTNKNLVVFRGTSPLEHFSLLPPSKEDWGPDLTHKGLRYTKPDFTSTSFDLEAAKYYSGDDGYIQRILIPRGTQGLNLHGLEEYQQSEYLLPHGAAFETLGRGWGGKNKQFVNLLYRGHHAEGGDVFFSKHYDKRRHLIARMGNNGARTRRFEIDPESGMLTPKARWYAKHRSTRFSERIPTEVHSVGRYANGGKVRPLGVRLSEFMKGQLRHEGKAPISVAGSHTDEDLGFSLYQRPGSALHSDKLPEFDYRRILNEGNNPPLQSPEEALLGHLAGAKSISGGVRARRKAKLTLDDNLPYFGISRFREFFGRSPRIDLSDYASPPPELKTAESLPVLHQSPITRNRRDPWGRTMKDINGNPIPDDRVGRTFQGRSGRVYHFASGGSVPGDPINDKAHKDFSNVFSGVDVGSGLHRIREHNSHQYEEHFPPESLGYYDLSGQSAHVRSDLTHLDKLNVIGHELGAHHFDHISFNEDAASGDIQALHDRPFASNIEGHPLNSIAKKTMGLFQHLGRDHIYNPEDHLHESLAFAVGEYTEMIATHGNAAKAFRKLKPFAKDAFHAVHTQYLPYLKGKFPKGYAEGGSVDDLLSKGVKLHSFLPAIAAQLGVKKSGHLLNTHVGISRHGSSKATREEIEAIQGFLGVLPDLTVKPTGAAGKGVKEQAIADMGGHAGMFHDMIMDTDISIDQVEPLVRRILGGTHAGGHIKGKVIEPGYIESLRDSNNQPLSEADKALLREKVRWSASVRYNADAQDITRKKQVAAHIKERFAGRTPTAKEREIATREWLAGNIDSPSVARTQGPLWNNTPMDLALTGEKVAVTDTDLEALFESELRLPHPGTVFQRSPESGDDIAKRILTDSVPKPPKPTSGIISRIQRLKVGQIGVTHHPILSGKDWDLYSQHLNPEGKWPTEEGLSTPVTFPESKPQLGLPTPPPTRITSGYTPPHALRAQSQAVSKAEGATAGRAFSSLSERLAAEYASLDSPQERSHFLKHYYSKIRSNPDLRSALIGEHGEESLRGAIGTSKSFTTDASVDIGHLLALKAAGHEMGVKVTKGSGVTRDSRGRFAVAPTPNILPSTHVGFPYTPIGFPYGQDVIHRRMMDDLGPGTGGKASIQEAHTTVPIVGAYSLLANRPSQSSSTPLPGPNTDKVVNLLEDIAKSNKNIANSNLPDNKKPLQPQSRGEGGHQLQLPGPPQLPQLQFTGPQNQPAPIPKAVIPLGWTGSSNPPIPIPARYRKYFRGVPAPVGPPAFSVPPPTPPTPPSPNHYGVGRQHPQGPLFGSPSTNLQLVNGLPAIDASTHKPDLPPVPLHYTGVRRTGTPIVRPSVGIFTRESHRLLAAGGEVEPDEYFGGGAHHRIYRTRSSNPDRPDLTRHGSGYQGGITSDGVTDHYVDSDGNRYKYRGKFVSQEQAAHFIDPKTGKIDESLLKTGFIVPLNNQPGGEIKKRKKKRGEAVVHFIPPSGSEVPELPVESKVGAHVVSPATTKGVSTPNVGVAVPSANGEDYAVEDRPGKNIPRKLTRVPVPGKPGKFEGVDRRPLHQILGSNPAPQGLTDKEAYERHGRGQNLIDGDRLHQDLKKVVAERVKQTHPEYSKEEHGQRVESLVANIMGKSVPIAQRTLKRLVIQEGAVSGKSAQTIKDRWESGVYRDKARAMREDWHYNNLKKNYKGKALSEEQFRDSARALANRDIRNKSPHTIVTAADPYESYVINSHYNQQIRNLKRPPKSRDIKDWSHMMSHGLDLDSPDYLNDISKFAPDLKKHLGVTSEQFNQIAKDLQHQYHSNPSINVEKHLGSQIRTVIKKNHLSEIHDINRQREDELHSISTETIKATYDPTKSTYRRKDAGRTRGRLRKASDWARDKTGGRLFHLNPLRAGARWLASGMEDDDEHKGWFHRFGHGGSAHATQNLIDKVRGGPSGPSDPDNPEAPPRFRSKVKGWGKHVISNYGQFGGFAIASFAPQLIEGMYGTVAHPLGTPQQAAKAQGVSGGITGSVVGAQVGSMIHPIFGTVIGGIVGAIVGYTTSITQANNEIKKLEFEKSFKGFEHAMDDVVSGRLSQSRGVMEFGTGVAKAHDEATRLVMVNGGGKGWWGRNFGWAGYQGSTSKEISSSFSRQHQEEVAQTLGNQVGNFRQLGDMIAEKVGETIDPKLIAGGATSEKDRKERIEEFKKRGGGKIASEISLISKVPIDQVLEGFDASIVSSARQKLKVESNRKAVAEATISVTKFDKVAQACDVASLALLGLKQSSNGLTALLEGQISAPHVTGFAEVASHIGGVDPSGFQRSLTYMRGKLGGGDGGLANEVEKLDSLMRELPDRLAHVGDISEGGIQGSISDAFKGMDPVQSAKLMNSVNTHDPKDLSHELRSNPKALAEKLIKDTFGDEPKLFHDILKQLQDQDNDFSDQVAHIARLGDHVQTTNRRGFGAQLGVARANAAYEGALSGRSASSLLTINDLLQPFRSTQSMLTGGKHLTTDQILARQIAIPHEIKKLREAVDNPLTSKSDRTKALESITALNTESQNLQKAQDNLADSSNQLAAIQEKLGSVESERSSKLGLTEKLLTSSPRDLMKFQAGEYMSGVAARQGNFAGFGYKQVEAVLEHLRGYGDIKLMGGLTGNEHAQRLLVNSGRVMGGVVATNDSQRLELLKQATTAEQTAAKALENIATYQKTLIDEHKKNLAAQEATSAKTFKRTRLTGELQTAKDAEGRATVEQTRTSAINDKAKSIDQLFRWGAGDNGVARARNVMAGSGSGMLSGVLKDEANLKRFNAGTLAEASTLKMTGDRKSFSILGNTVRNGAGIETMQSDMERSIPVLASHLGMSHDSVKDAVIDFAAKKRKAHLKGPVFEELFHTYANQHFHNSLKEAHDRYEETLGSRKAEAHSQISRDAYEGGSMSARRKAMLEGHLANLPEFHREMESLGPIKNVQEAAANFDKAGTALAAFTANVIKLTTDLRGVEAEHKSLGGPIFKKKGTDTVPAMLTPGEFVVNASSTRHNRGLLEQINRTKAPLYRAEGGDVQRYYLKLGEPLPKFHVNVEDNYSGFQYLKKLANKATTPAQIAFVREHLSRMTNIHPYDREMILKKLASEEFKTNFREGQKSRRFPSDPGDNTASVRRLLHSAHDRDSFGEALTAYNEVPTSLRGKLSSDLQQARIRSQGTHSFTGTHIHTSARVGHPTFSHNKHPKRADRENAFLTYFNHAIMSYYGKDQKDLSPEDKTAALRNAHSLDLLIRSHRNVLNPTPTMQRALSLREKFEKSEIGKASGYVHMSELNARKLHKRKASRIRRNNSALSTELSRYSPRNDSFLNYFEGAVEHYQGVKDFGKETLAKAKKNYKDLQTYALFLKHNHKGSALIRAKSLLAFYNSSDIGKAAGHYSQGGWVPKGTDTVPAMLSPGEFVVNSRGSQANRHMLEDINHGKKVHYKAAGGPVGWSSGSPVAGGHSSLTLSSQSMSALKEFTAGFEGGIKGLHEALSPCKLLADALKPFNDAALSLSKTLAQVNIPSIIKVETRSTVEVLINGASVLAAIKGDMASVVTAEVLAKLEGEVKRIIKEMPAR